MKILREPVLNCVTQISELWARGGEGHRLNPHALGDGKESQSLLSDFLTGHETPSPVPTAAAVPLESFKSSALPTVTSNHLQSREMRLDFPSSP